MAPINNESERMLRKTAISRKIRHRITSQTNIIMFSNIMMWIQTWKKFGRNVSEILLEIPSGA